VNTNAARYQNLSINQTKLSGQCGRLKCCLNYELDTYMDALQFFPTDADMLETAKGRAFLVKKDIFRNLMWYTMADSNKQYPLAIDMVKKIKLQNREGIKPEVLETAEVITGKPKEVEPEYADIVGQISLNSLEKNSRKRRDKERGQQQGQGNRGQGQQPRGQQRGTQQSQERQGPEAGRPQRGQQPRNPQQQQARGPQANRPAQQQPNRPPRPPRPAQGGGQGQGQGPQQGRQARPQQNRGPQRPRNPNQPPKQDGPAT
jgi:hypothetical protein